MNYRSIGKDGERWPEWVVELDGKSGVYAIREGGKLVYIGESHKGRLRTTLQRHFQRWRRKKKWWSGLLGKDHDPGLTYDRSACTVGVSVMSASKAVDAQYAMIRRLKPRDNMVDGDGTLAEAPF